MSTDGITYMFPNLILVVYYNPENYKLILTIPNIIWITYASVNLILNLT